MASRKRKVSRSRRVFGGILWSMTLVGALGVGTVAGWLGKSEVFSKGGFQAVVNMRRDPKEVFKDDAMNILILGCDEDLYYGGKQVLKPAARSDMMLVARLDFAKNRITGLSIPRDTRCQLPGDVPRKINAYHAIAPRGQGPELAREAVEHLLDNKVKIDRVVVVDYVAFVEFVDLIGGVQVYTPIDLKYVDRAGNLFVDIPKGTHKLGGYDAMGFVRIRKNAGDDYMRQDRQKQLLVGVKNQVGKQWTRLPVFIDAGIKVLGNSFDLAEISAMANFASKVPKDAIKLGALPTYAARRSSFLNVRQSELSQTLVEYGLIDEGPAVAHR